MKIIVLAGGLSTERDVSLASAAGICKTLLEKGHDAFLLDARKTVPSNIARIVPFGLFHISFKLYSVIRAAFGVMVAHLTPTPYFFVAFAESMVTWSFVALRLSKPKS